MRSKHPPLPTAIRPFYLGLRVFGGLVALAGVVLAVLYAINDEWSVVAWCLGLGLSFAVLTWLPPTSRWLFPLMILLGVAIAISLKSWLIAGALFAIFAWTAWSLGRIGSLPDEIEIAEQDAVMENATEFVQSFRSLGFEHVGAYRAKIGPVEVVVSLLLSADGASYASVTDAVLEVTSLFPDSHSMVTRNTHQSALPPVALVNPDPGAGPDELFASHRRALETLAQHGHVPTTLKSAEVTQKAIDSELHMIEWLKDKTRIPRPKDRSPLWDRPDSSMRIAAWHVGQD